MTVQLNPYLHFDTECREAITFYQSVLGGELALNTFGEYGVEGELADRVMHVSLTTPDGLVLMASDVAPGTTAPTGGSVSLSLSGDDETRMRGWFEAFAEGGEIHVPLEKQMWGDVFGQCADRFGITWLVNIGPS